MNNMVKPVHYSHNFSAAISSIENAILITGEESDPIQYSPVLEQGEYVVTNNYSALTVHGDPLTYQQSQDISDSRLYAQLAANGDLGPNARFDVPIQWYQAYTSKLSTVGWAYTDINFRKYHSSDKKFTMDKAVLDLIGDIVKGASEENYMKILGDVLKAFKALPEDNGGVVLFNKNTASSSGANLQIGIAGHEPETGSPRIFLTAFYFRMDVTRERILWFEFDSSSEDIYASTTTLVLDSEIYARVREQIRDKVSYFAEKEVFEQKLAA